MLVTPSICCVAFGHNIFLSDSGYLCKTRLRELARSGADALGRVLPPYQPSEAHYTAMALISSFIR